MGLLDGAVPGNEVILGGRLKTVDGEDSREESAVGVPNGISDGQEAVCNRYLFWYRDQGSTAWDGGQ